MAALPGFSDHKSRRRTTPNGARGVTAGATTTAKPQAHGAEALCRSPGRRVRGKNTAQRPKKRRRNGLSNRLSARPFQRPVARGRACSRPRPCRVIQGRGHFFGAPCRSRSGHRTSRVLLKPKTRFWAGWGHIQRSVGYETPNSQLRRFSLRPRRVRLSSETHRASNVVDRQRWAIRNATTCVTCLRRSLFRSTQ
jgi:hypothetical protein